MDYRWSSIRLYSQEQASLSFVDPDFVLNVLSGAKSNKVNNYSRLLKHGSKMDIGHVLEKEDAIERLGSKLKAKFPKILKKAEQKKKIRKPLDIDLLDIEALEKQIAEILNAPNPNTHKTRKAKKYIIEQLLARGFKKTEIADRLGISRKTVYNILKLPM
jgi:putative transposase